jgi:hypothetical protein
LPVGYPSPTLVRTFGTHPENSIQTVHKKWKLHHSNLMNLVVIVKILAAMQLCSANHSPLSQTQLAQF